MWLAVRFIVIAVVWLLQPLIFCMHFDIFFSKSSFSKHSFRNTRVWIQTRLDVLLVLILVQTAWKGYQQKTPVGMPEMVESSTRENHCTRTAQSLRGGCSRRVRRKVYIAVKKGNVMVNILLLKNILLSDLCFSLINPAVYLLDNVYMS